jgi:hypothetical protein
LQNYSGVNADQLLTSGPSGSTSFTFWQMERGSSTIAPMLTHSVRDVRIRKTAEGTER